MGEGFPESDLVRKSFTIRQLDFPPQVQMTRRSLLRWFCLSFGLISEKESRSTIIDVLDGFFVLNVSKGVSPTTYELLAHLKENGKKVDEKLLRYHLKRLIDVGLVERRKGRLSFVSAPDCEPKDLVKGFEHHIGRSVQASLSNVSLALEKLNEKYKG